MTATSPESTAASTPEPKPFHDLEEYVALPRVSGLALSTDGRRLVTAVATLDAKRTAYVTALWEVDPSGERPARRLTRSAKGESSAAFTPSGDLLFTSARPDPEPREGADYEPARALWLLPADGAEARVVADRAAGFAHVRVATDAGVVLLGSDVLPRALDDADDERLRKARKDKKIGAILHTGYPVRYWDHDLGPAEPHLFAATVRADRTAPRAGQPDPRLELRDITPHAGPALTEQAAAISPDGRTVVTGWFVPLARGEQRSRLVAIEVATSERRVLVDDLAADLASPVVSPDGRWVAYSRETLAAPDCAPRVELWVVGIDGSGARQLAVGWDRWPHSAIWAPDSASLLVLADDDGRGPVFRVDLKTTAVTRLTSDDAVFSDLQISPDGSTLYALRASYLAPAHPVRIDLAAAASSGAPVAATGLPAPALAPALPGHLTEIETTA
ncbi:MAG TPA: S9 family peptidase, partial [Cellulomonas sp.]|nr:S9 family peptidase [Cellulomonas sp.]